MNTKQHLEAQRALREIGLALHATHNTVTTDIPGVQPNQYSWCIDHSQALEQLGILEGMLLNGTDNTP